MPELPSGTVTFFISDISGSIRRWAGDGMAEALAQHDALTRAAIEEHGGTVVKHTGDGFLAAFSDGVAAVDAAVDTQRRLDAATWATEPIRVRIALHTGHAEPVGGDYFGLVVSTAARINDVAHPGQIVASEATRVVAEAPQAGGFALDELGMHRLKDLDQELRLYQVTADGLPSEFPPLKSLQHPQDNLPRPLTSFVGRDAELRELTELVAEHRLTTLTGVGGAGKTRLAVEAARKLASRYRDGAWLVELAPFNSHEGVVAAIAAALSFRFEEGDPVDASERLVERLAEWEMLLVLDNCEHVLASAASIAARILDGCPDVTLVASSREGLGVPGERIWQTPSLSVSDEAIRLFTERAQDAGASLQLDEKTRPHVESICRLLDGMPLAIELAAARARLLSPAQIEERLDDRFHLLTGGSRMALPRQQTLEATVDWSYQLLDDDDRTLFARLSVFQGGFSLGAVEEVCSDDAVSVLDVLDLMGSLLDKSMITAESSDAEPARYGMLETLRQYAERKLFESEQTASWKSRHAEWFAAQAEAHNPQRTLDLDDYDWLRLEAANLSAALEWSRNAVPHLVAPLAEALGLHNAGTVGDPAEALKLLDEAAGAADPDDLERHADIAARRAWTFQMLGEPEMMLEAGSQAVELAGRGSDRGGIRVLVLVASIYAAEPEVEAGLGTPLAREAVARARESGDATYLARALRSLLWSLIWEEDVYDEIESLASELIEIAGDDHQAVADGLSLLSLATMTEDYRKGTDLTTAVEDELLRRLPEDYVGEEFAWIGIRRADWALAQLGIDRISEHFRGRFRLGADVPRACMLWMRGQLEQADAVLESARELGRVGRWHHDFYPIWAEVNTQLGRLDRVRAIVDEHLALPVKAAEEQMKLATLRALVQAHVDAGDAESARVAAERMEGILTERERKMTGSVQLGSPEGYLACARAELTRLDGPSPEAWREAQRLTTWEYWKVYCEARAAEATLETSGEATEQISAAADRARRADATWVLSWLERLA